MLIHPTYCAYYFLSYLTLFPTIIFAAPPPSHASPSTAVKCYDPNGDRTKWMYPRGRGGCHVLDHLTDGPLTANNIVFTFQIPFVRENSVLDFSRWQQNLIGILQPGIQYYRNSTLRTFYNY